MEKSMDVYVHGVGSSCYGEEYHHQVYHLVVGGVTLCGVQLRGKHWWRAHSVLPHHFRKDDGSEVRYNREDIICRRCSAIKHKNENGKG